MSQIDLWTAIIEIWSENKNCISFKNLWYEIFLWKEPKNWNCLFLNVIEINLLEKYLNSILIVRWLFILTIINYALKWKHSSSKIQIFCIKRLKPLTLHKLNFHKVYQGTKLTKTLNSLDLWKDGERLCRLSWIIWMFLECHHLYKFSVTYDTITVPINIHQQILSLFLSQFVS